MVLSLFLSRKRKSLELVSSLICSPAFILWAFTMISLPAACRNIFCSFMQENALHSSRSLSTWPGPTLGSWDASPTRISLVPGIMAFNRARKSRMSTMDTSSIITTSASRGLSSSFWKNIPESSSPAAPPNSSSLWMVTAS